MRDELSGLISFLERDLGTIFWKQIHDLFKMSLPGKQTPYQYF